MGRHPCYLALLSSPKYTGWQPVVKGGESDNFEEDPPSQRNAEIKHGLECELLDVPVYRDYRFVKQPVLLYRGQKRFAFMVLPCDC
jgi:hypothetical protein